MMSIYGEADMMNIGKCGRDLLVDSKRPFSEDEKRYSIKIQTTWRGQEPRKEWKRLQKQGASVEAVDFQRAVKDSGRVQTNVEVAPADVKTALQAPVGALLAMFQFHKAYKEKAASNFWALWKCFIRNALLDLPLGLTAHFFLLCFAGAAFYAPMWASVTVRFIFYDGDGQIEIDKFVRWLMVFALCTTAMWCLACIFFVLLQERFGNRVKHHITIISAEYGKLISKSEVDRFRSSDLASTKRIFFKYAPMGLACFLVSIAGLNFLFLRSKMLGSLTVGTIMVSGLFIMLYDKFVQHHASAVDEAIKTESEFWTYLQSKDKDIALSEIMALSDATAKFSVKESFWHITMGGTYRMMMLLSVVMMVFVGSNQIKVNDIRQYELLFCFFYYLFTLNGIFWLNGATVGILTDLGAAFRLAHFLNGTLKCVNEHKMVIPTEPGVERVGVRRLQAKTARPPFGVILISTLLFVGAIGSFTVIAATGKASITCRPAEMSCRICGKASHKIMASQVFDMDAGCVFEKTAFELSDECVASATPAQKRKLLQSSSSQSVDNCDVHVTFLSGQGDDTGYHVYPNSKKIGGDDLCADVECPKKDDCHGEGTCSKKNGECVYPMLADNTTCITGGQEGMCVAGGCKVLPLFGAGRRRVAEAKAEEAWHKARRVRQLAHHTNENMQLSPHERMNLRKLNARKLESVTKFAQNKAAERQKARELQDAMGMNPVPEYTTCPLPGDDPTQDCPASHIRGCMDSTAVNYNPQANQNTACCYAPDRYVKVDMVESIFQENFWTMKVDGQMVGLGVPVVGQNEVCVPADACVKVSVFDDSCDGFGVGGGGISVLSAFHDGMQVQKSVDSSGQFECSKNVHFGDCPVEGCTDSMAINFNVDAGVDDGSCEYANCAEKDKAVVVKVTRDEKPEETEWKITDSNGYTLVDSSEFSHMYSDPTTTDYYCFPSDKCLYFLIKDTAGNGLSTQGHYEVMYGRSGAFQVAAAGREFEWIKAHFIGGGDDCKR